MQSLCMLMPYSGPWPRWFSLYLETCRWNPSVNWLFLADHEWPHGHPANVSFVHLTLQDFRRLASEKLGMEVAEVNAYKLCDYRPAFGKIFEDHIGRYDFWGWGDLDVIYGDIRSFLTDRMLTEFDVISARQGFLAGEMSWFRNTPEIGSLFWKSADAKRIFSATDYYNFDECSFFKNKHVESMTHLVKKEVGNGRMKALFLNCTATDKKMGPGDFAFHWKKGILRDLKAWRYLMLYHFLERKKSASFSFPELQGDVSDLLITADGVQVVDDGFSPKPDYVSMAKSRVIAAMKNLKSLAAR